MTRKNNDIPMKQKIEIAIFMKNNPGLSQRSVAKTFKLSVGSINKIFKDKDNLIKKQPENFSKIAKRKRTLSKTSQFDEILFQWIQNQRMRNIILSNVNIKSMALVLAEKFGIMEFDASDGYVRRFKARHCLITKTINGEAGMVNIKQIDNFSEFFNRKLCDYDKCDVYDCDEAGLFWRQNANKTVVMGENDKACGKMAKERVTILFCVSRTGEKLSPLVIGKSKTPQSFKGRDITKMNLSYTHNSKAWMNLMTFKSWLEMLNMKIKSENRKILLILDNAPVHPIEVEYSNIELLYLPPNTTSLIQPCDQGIIKTFKTHYKRMLSSKIIFELDNTENKKLDYSELIKKITIYDAMCFIHCAWNKVSKETVINCFEKALKNAGIKHFCEPNQNTISYEQVESSECLPYDPIITENDEAFIESLLNKEENNKDTIDAIEEKILVPPKELTPINILEMLDDIQEWFFTNKIEGLELILDLKDQVVEEKLARQIKITDFIKTLRK